MRTEKTLALSRRDPKYPVFARERHRTARHRHMPAGGPASLLDFDALHPPHLHFG